MDWWGIEIAKQEQKHNFGVVLMEFITSRFFFHKNSNNNSSSNKKNPINVIKFVTPHICAN
jgi:hypothetical protein